MSETLRYERIFDEIRADMAKPDACHTTAILRGMEAIAMELSELNVAASSLMDLTLQMDVAIAHLEQIDDSTAEATEIARERDADR